MRKIGLSLLALIVVAAIYYFTSGSTQLALQLKEQVDAQMATLQNKGFVVTAKEVDTKKEHFVITMDEPEKIAAFLTAKGMQTTAKDLESLKGLKIGVDAAYLADAYSAASFDIYPLALPTSLSLSSVSENDKKVLQQIEKMIEKKTFLLHLDVNKLGTGFKGYMKDIDEVIEDDKKVKLSMKSLKFTGDIKDDKLSGIKQTLDSIAVQLEDNSFDVKMDNLKSNYKVTGASNYDYASDYTVENISIFADDTFKMTMKNFTMDSISKEQDGLLSVTANTTLDTIDFKDGQKSGRLEALVFDMQAKNFDIQALTKLETIDPENEEELLAVAQQVISQGIQFSISDFSVKHIEFDKKKLDGFMLTSAFDIDKSLDLSSLEKNPMAAINAMDANLKLTLSNQLFAVIAQQPQAVMAMMLFQPKDVNGDKVYKVELKNGKLTVNERPVM